MPRSLRLLAFAALAALAAPGLTGCVGGDPKHPLVGRAKPIKSEPGYWIYVDDEWLHFRLTASDRGHRFQGSVTALKGNLGALELERPALAEQVALQGSSIQFDLELPKGADEGFRVRIDKRCVRFDLYIDGFRRAERVHLGPRLLLPKAIPFDRCP